MIISILDLFFTMLGYGWKLISWIADLSLRFFSSLFSFGLKAVGAVFSVFLTPFTYGADRLLDWTSMDMRGFFSLVMWVLLGACALLALFAAGSSVYRKYRHRL